MREKEKERRKIKEPVGCMTNKLLKALRYRFTDHDLNFTM